MERRINTVTSNWLMRIALYCIPKHRPKRIEDRRTLKSEVENESNKIVCNVRSVGNYTIS